MKKRFILFLIILCMGLIPKVILAETYDGEYSVDYLLRNYNLVTLGQKDINLPIQNGYGISKGNLNCQYNIEGAILVNGNYSSDSSSNFTFGSNAGTIKSVITGTKSDNITTTSSLITDSNYIDFKKMYTQVMSESQSLADNAEYHINSAKMEISKPGNYIINNTSKYYYSPTYGGNNIILIKNYDPNNYYIFNMYDEYVDWIPEITIMESGAANATHLINYIENGNYTGNIIFNFPNAKYMYNYNSYPIYGTIIAPKADIMIGTNYVTHCTIIANSINYYSYNYYSQPEETIKKINMSIGKKLQYDDISYFTEVKDYQDDLYTRDYSISDLLQNYSLVTLGHKAIDSKSKLLQFGNKPGSIKLFHTTGQALIAGDLYSKKYENEEDEYFSYHSDNYNNVCNKFDRNTFDLESNKVTESYIRGNVFKEINCNYSNTNGESGSYANRYSVSVIQPWDNMTNDNINYYDKKNKLIVGEQNQYISSSGSGNFTMMLNNYLNFDRLYSNIVSEQSKIEEGTSITPNNGKAHVRVGGSYVIDDINDIDEIIFDNFDDNKKYITVITIKNSGDINFPLISKDTGSYKGIVTNDYFGKEQATHLYEQDTFTQDTYFGNIVWNIPNATYIKLKANAPFAGHMIAPNADVETPETHFAGCFIVNSIYGEGNTEAHFYPLTATSTYDVPEYDDLASSELSNLSNMRLKRLLGGKGSQIETTVIGNEEEFRREEAKLNDILDKEEKNKNNVIPPITDILQNPLTKRSILIVFVILTIIGVTLYKTYKKKS